MALVDGGVVVLIGAEVINEVLGTWIPVAELDIGRAWWLGLGTAVLDFGAANTEAAAAAPV